ncbi:MAG TPA: hypothetical protein VGF48_26060 [Thermoanaerobaculia bacterium]|jgi:hypothetical protein
MRAYLIAVAFAALPLVAHPPVSVVVDARGNVYYSDLEQVWRFAPDGARTVVVPNVHTHELYMDAAGNLFGEQSTYERQKWAHSVWKRSPDGRITQVIPRRDGFLTNYSFVRDASGTMYFANLERTEVRKRAPDGRISTIARGFRDIRWMHATPRGTLFFVDNGAVHRIAGGKVSTLARNLGARRHALMGLWTDSAENLYVADHANRVVKRITPRGEVTIVARSVFPWSVAGGGFGRRGELILLEVSDTNQVRVRRP